MFNLVLFLLSGILWKIGDCVISWEVTHHKDNSNGYTWEEADTICKENGKVLAVVDSQEKWEKLKYVITGGNRYTAPADVYIGLQFTGSINNFTWSNGVQASWTKWYDNEPYFTDTRHCVRLDVYTDYSFRTSDCSYKHHFACSYEVYIPDPVVQDLVTSTPAVYTGSSGINSDMIVGMSVAFGIFLGIGIIICILCRCCCNFQQEKKYAENSKASKQIIPTRLQAQKQFEICMSQMEGVDYSRAKSSAAASVSYSRNQNHDDVFDVDDHPSNVIDIAPYNDISQYDRDDSMSLNDSSSPSNKSTDYMHFM
ncbi:chondrolectin-like isoform X1 [Mytilus trossulus]|uniref:chondrolectin-like isoform X1 n=1 Tax=Mytilus trossulus TaxID=6551 RepID=UPI003006D826